MSSAAFYKWRTNYVDIANDPHEGLGGGKPETQEDVCREAAQI